MRLHAALLVVIAVSAPAQAEPWRLGKAIDAPRWLTLGLEQRSRYEYLSHDFRAKAAGDTAGLSLRTLLSAEGTFTSFVAGVEVEDARIYASDDTPLNTTLSNPLEILQAYGGVRTKSVDVRAGRITVDLGTRRLVSRNRFRNTINGFTGVDGKWTSSHKHVARAFVVVPVTRLPDDADALRDNEIELDEENTDAVLWGAAYGSPALSLGSQVEAFAVGFHERDGDVASRNRQLITLGLRWYRKPARGALDFDLEVMPQLGTTRATTADDDVTKLDERAWSTHAELGTSPAFAMKPRLALLHDYASGDRDPTDRRTQRFDPLFGSRRSDFGPTGLYGEVNRSNIQSPGLRVSFSPAATVEATATYRWFWLASARDAWVAANVKDASGDSGRFVGEHVEGQLRWTPLAKSLSIEGGAAYLRRGDFAKTAPDTRRANAAYFYVQVTATL